jgi:hypothetical protein
VKKDMPPLKSGGSLSSQRMAKRGTGERKLSDEQIPRLELLGVWWSRKDKGENPQNSVDE